MPPVVTKSQYAEEDYALQVAGQRLLLLERIERAAIFRGERPYLIAPLLGVSNGSYFKWKKAYRKLGLAGLMMNAGSCRRSFNNEVRAGNHYRLRRRP